MKGLINWWSIFALSFLFFQCGGAKITRKGVDMDIEYKYPKTERKVVVDTIFGEEIEDPYRWLEDFDNEGVQKWIKGQNELCNSIMEKLSRKENLYEEYLKLYETKVMSLPKRYGDRYFYRERDGLMNHSITYTTKGNLRGEKIEVLNPNEWSEDGTVSLDWMYPSPDGSIIAYGKSEKGSEESTLYLLDVERGKSLPDVIERTRASAVAWLPDKSGFYYTRYPKKGEVPPGDEHYYRGLYFHKIGQEPSKDPLIFGEGRGKEEWVSVNLSSEEDYILIYSYLGGERNDLYIKETEPTGEVRTIAEGLESIFSADVIDGKVYIQTNWKAPKARIMVTDIKNLSSSDWKELIPEGDGILQEFYIIGRKLVLRYLKDVHTRIGIFSLEGKHLYDLDFPTMGSAEVSGRWDSPLLLCSFESFFYPPTIFQFNLETKERETIFQMDVKRDLSLYELKQVRYKSKDGTEIPLWLMYRKGIKLDGDTPTILTGYGGFNISMNPWFTRTILPWLDKGGIYAIACLRGGGEFGKEWHEAGMLANKQNVFDDFISASEWLIENKWTNPNKLAIRGGSNGGLLMGAALTQRPDLYKAVECGVPLLDMLRYHKFSIARIWIPEYGSAENKEQFEYLKKYSPYNNVDPTKDYPAIFFNAGQSDTRVHPMHAMKMAALMQGVADKDKPVLLYVEPKSGHGVGRPLKMALKDISNQYLFLMWQLGMI